MHLKIRSYCYKIKVVKFDEFTFSFFFIIEPEKSTNYIHKEHLFAFAYNLPSVIDTISYNRSAPFTITEGAA